MIRNQHFHNFVLVLSGISEPDERLENALLAAGCDDGTLAFRNRVGYIEFDREAPRLEAAILSAIRNVEHADPRITVVSVEPGDSVNASEIARRAQVSREYVRLLVEGKRGEGDFPAPQSGITSKTLVWSWVDVVRWLFGHKLLDDRSIVDTAETIHEINDALDVRQHPATMDRRLQYVRKLQKSKNR